VLGCIVAFYESPFYFLAGSITLIGQNVKVGPWLNFVCVF